MTHTRSHLYVNVLQNICDKILTFRPLKSNSNNIFLLILIDVYKHHHAIKIAKETKGKTKKKKKKNKGNKEEQIPQVFVVYDCMHKMARKKEITYKHIHTHTLLYPYSYKQLGLIINC